MQNIIIQHNKWFLLLPVLVGAVYAYALYFRQKKFQEKSAFLIAFLFVLRFLSVGTIVFLLLSPFFKFFTEQKNKPILILAQDYSESLKNTYSNEELNLLNKDIKRIESELQNKYDVRTFGFGGDVYTGLRDSFNLKSTNISKLLSLVNESYDDYELAGVVISTDGIFNEGALPDYFPLKHSVPFYNVALGDTIAKRDVYINAIYHNDIAFLGDKTEIKVDVKAVGYKGETTSLQLYKIDDNGKSSKLGSKTVEINRDNFFTSKVFEIDVNKVGIAKYRITLGKLENEFSYKNNRKNAFIEVIDSKVKVLIYANSPNPDIGALKEALVSNKNYEVSLEYENKPINPRKYDLLIYHNLPSSKNNLKSIETIVQNANIPQLFIVGNQTDINRLNQIQKVIEIRKKGSSSDEVQAQLNTDFKLFQTTDNGIDKLEKFPPLFAPFGEYMAKPNTQVLLFQKINNIKTNRPLMVLGTDSHRREAVLSASNLYKWRLYNYLSYENTDFFTSLFTQVVQYLTIKKDKSQWRVKSTKNIYQDSETIVFDAELYNDNYERTNEPEAYLKVRDQGNHQYNYVFSGYNGSYRLEVGTLPPGNYSFVAGTRHMDKDLKKKGSFSVVEKDLEKFDLVAKHGTLNKLSSRTNGKTFYIDQIDALIDTLKQNEAKPVIHYGQHTKMVLDLKWIFWLIILLLSIEWFVRRYNGSF